MKLTHDGQRQFINMLRNKNSNRYRLYCAALFIVAVVIKGYALIYCVWWGFGLTITIQQAFIVGAIAGLYADRNRKVDKPIDLVIIQDMLSSVFLSAFVYLLSRIDSISTW